MTAQHRKQINEDITALVEAFRRSDAEPPLEPTARLIARVFEDLNRVADALEMGAKPPKARR